jgi:hypothetical protein
LQYFIKETASVAGLMGISGHGEFKYSFRIKAVKTLSAAEIIHSPVAGVICAKI